MAGNLFGNVTLKALAATALLGVAQANAAAVFEISDTQWVSLGGGVRTSFRALEDGAGAAGDNYATDFNLDNARIYINGQFHEYVKFEFNTERVFCGNTDLQEYTVLDAIAKFEFTPAFNIWAGRMLVPADRAELSGPFYANTYDFNRTPFYPADFSTEFGSGGAGVYGRDHGINVCGAAGPETRLQYVFGVFDGLQNISNVDDNLLFGARVAYNFWDVEKNPGYYTSSTYYGQGRDILTLAYAAQYQEDGAGTAGAPADFLGMSADLLMEKTLGGAGVITVEGEYKTFNLSGFDPAVAFAPDADCFCMFDGDSWTATGLYLLPQKIGIGQFQPYVRYTSISPDASSDRDESEAGVNYIIDGHNARLSLFYEYGDFATKGLDYSPAAAGDEVSAIKLALQVQI